MTFARSSRVRYLALEARICNGSSVIGNSLTLPCLTSTMKRTYLGKTECRPHKWCSMNSNHAAIISTTADSIRLFQFGHLAVPIAGGVRLEHPVIATSLVCSAQFGSAYSDSAE